MSMVEVGGVDSPCMVRKEIFCDPDAGFPKPLQTPAGNTMIGISDTDHHASDTSRDDGIDTGGGSALVDTRLEVHIQGRPPARLAGPLQSCDLGMVRAGSDMRALPEYCSTRRDHDRAHTGVGMRVALPGQRNSPAHVSLVKD